MTQRTDAILHINDVPALIAWFAEAAPDKLNADVEVDDGAGGAMTYTPPALFGMMG